MISLRHKSGLTILGLSMATALSPALAQVAPPPRSELPTREEINRAAPPADLRPPSRLTVEGGIERAPCPLADPRFADVRVTIREALFDNLRMVSPDTLRPAYEAYLGTEQPIAVVCEIRDAAATILRRQGYLAAVQVPAQRIENGVVHFNVLMAKLVAIQVRGDAGKSERTIAAYLAALKEQPVFNERDAERYLLLARDLPGYDVRLTLRPAGTRPGEVIGEVSVSRTLFAVDANVQNYGSHAVGPVGMLLRGEAYGLLGLGDRLTAGFYSTPDFDEQHVVQLGYDLRAGREGLTIGGRFAYAWTEPDLGRGVNARLAARTLVAGGEVGYPFIRSQAINLRGAAGFELIDQTSRLLPDAGGRIPISEDHIRALYARLDFEALDRASIRSVRGYSPVEPRWRIGGSLEMRKGLNILGASDDCGPAPYLRCYAAGAVPLSRLQGKPDAFLVRFSGTGEYRPLPRISLALSPRAQYAADPLLSYDQFSGGNFTVGRGYDPGAVLGDSGVGLQTELRYGTLLPRSRSAITLQPYAFYDHAWAWTRGSPSAPLNPDPQQLASAGLGVRGAWGDRARLDLTLAVPLRRAGYQTRRGDAVVLVSFSTRLWPWSR